MKKNFKRLTAILLAVLVVASMSVSAFANMLGQKGDPVSLNPYHGPSYSTYLLLGDSVAEGYALPGFDRTKRFTRVEGSYGAYVADAVKAKTYLPYAQDGFRAAEFRMLLDDNYNGDELTDTQIPEATDGYADSAKLKAERPKYQDAVKKANLITIDVGFNDLWLPLVHASNQLTAAIDYPKVLLTWEKDFEENYGALVQKIFELNPKATVVLVGSYNPCKHWAFPAYTPIYVGKALDIFFNQMNDYKKSVAEKYGSKCHFADVSDVETVTEYNDAIMVGFDPHPTADGHRYMANQILATLQ